MKMYKINSFTTFLFSFLVIGFVVFLPIVFIELLWNSTIGKNFSDITIDFWQGLILWLIVLVLLNILGIFKFEFAVQTNDSFDNEILKQKLDSMKSNVDEDSRSKTKTNKETDKSK